MRTPVRLTLFALGLVVAFAGAAGLGHLTGPVGPAAADTHTALAGHAGMGLGEDHEAGPVTAPLGGLAVTAAGFTLALQESVLPAGQEARLAFQVRNGAGQPLQAYSRTHDKELHLVVVRRDTQHFQHVHPVRDATGTWSLPLTLPAPGAYKAFVDFTPAGADKPVVLAADLSAPGDYQPAPLPAVADVTTGGGYEVRLSGDLVAGQASTITLAVSRGGRPVADLQPYLGAFGHVVVLREGDLAYLHVHPQDEGAATAGGPVITFEVDVPTSGRYRLFLDFKHDDRVRTAPFTVVTTEAS